MYLPNDESIVNDQDDSAVRRDRRRFLKWSAATLGAACAGPLIMGCPADRAVIEPSRSEKTGRWHGGCHARFDGNQLFADGQLVGRIVPLPDPDLECRDHTRELGGGLIEWERIVTLRADAAARQVRVTLDFIANHVSAFSLIPAVSYDGNHWGGGREPKGFTRDGTPWSYAFHRTAIPGGTYSEGPRWAVALWANTSRTTRGGSCALVPATDHSTHRLIWPEEETPLVYSGRDAYEPPYVETMTLEPGESFAASAYLLVVPSGTPKTAWRRWLDVVWAGTTVTPRYRFAPEQLWSHGVRFASQELWAEEGVFRGFSIGLLTDGRDWFQRKQRKYEIGWAGQNASLACALLADYLRTGNQASLDKGSATLDTWARHGRFASRLVYAVIDPLLAGSPPDYLDACNLGDAAKFYFEAFDLVRRCGLSKPEYRELALGVCDFMLEAQQPDGRYGREWTPAGDCVSIDGTIGCFIVPAMIAAFRTSNRREYLESAERGYRAYSRGLAEQGFTTAGALDTDCIDKESAWPLMEAGLELFDLTGNREYLDAAEAAAFYTATWQYCHTVPVPFGSMFADMNYDSYGGTAVSTQHHHLDPYGLRFVPVFLRLGKLTGNPMWLTRARAAWYNGMIGVSDGTLKLGGVMLPTGGQCEGYFQTRWIDRGNCSLWLVAWPTAFRLEVLRKMPDWRQLEI